MNTVMSSQNVTTNTNIATASTRKLRNVNPSLTNSIAILHVSDAQYAYSSSISAVPNTRGLAAQAVDAEGVSISVEPNQRPTSVFKKQAAWSDPQLGKTEKSDRTSNPNEKQQSCYCSALPKGSGLCLTLLYAMA